MRLVLLRHGQTPANVAGALDTSAPGSALTTLGHEQAAAVARVLGDVRGLYASDRVRTQLTAAPLADRLGAQVPTYPGLGEIWAGDFEMRTDHEAVMAYATNAREWVEGDLEHRLPGGESGHEFLERYDGALAALCSGHADDDLVVAVSHGAAIRTWTAMRATSEFESPHVLSNTGCVELDGDPERGWRVVAWTLDPVGGAHLRDAGAHDVTGEDPVEIERS